MTEPKSFLALERKRCVRCGAVQPVSEFYGEKKSSDGLRSWCKDCVKEGAKNSKRNPDVHARGTQRRRPSEL